MGTRQPHKQKRSFKQRIYNTASNTWTITSWIWTAIIIVFVIQFIPTYLFSSTSQTWKAVLSWLGNDAMAFPWNVLRIFAIIALPLLAGLTILSWTLKRSLQEKSEGLDKLIEVLERDTITPQLEILQEQFRQLLQTQATSTNVLWRLDDRLKILQEQFRQLLQTQATSDGVLSRLDDRLQQMPTSTDLKNLQALAHQRAFAWKKKFHQALQDIYTRTTEQVGRLGDLFQQSQHTQETISADLRAIACILERQHNEVEVTPLPQEPASDTVPRQPGSGAEPDRFVTTEPCEGIVTPLPLDQLRPSSAERIEPSTPEIP